MGIAGFCAFDIPGLSAIAGNHFVFPVESIPRMAEKASAFSVVGAYMDALRKAAGQPTQRMPLYKQHTGITVAFGGVFRILMTDARERRERR